MPRSFGKVDASVSWDCRACANKHMPGSACPRRGIWLVLSLCHRCNPKTGAYCHRHGGHRPADIEPAEVDLEQLAAAGEEERRRIGGDA